MPDPDEQSEDASTGSPACDIGDSVFDWMLHVPQAEAVFRKYGIDHSCGGISLEYACQKANLSPAFLMQLILTPDSKSNSG